MAYMVWAGVDVGGTKTALVISSSLPVVLARADKSRLFDEILAELALTAERERELIGRAQCGCQRARK